MIPKIAPASSPKNQGASWSIARTAVQKPDGELTEVNRITLLGQRLNNLNKWLTRSRCPVLSARGRSGSATAEPSRSRVRGQDSERREASGPPGRTAHEIRAHHQPQDRQGARPRNYAIATRAGRRCDRMIVRCPLLAQSGHPANTYECLTWR